MKFGELYTSVTKNPLVQDTETGTEQTAGSIQKSEARIQAIHSWKQSTVTQEFVKQTKDEINDLLAKTIGLAVAYPQSSNHQQIIQNLIKVHTLEEVLSKHIYGK